MDSSLGRTFLGWAAVATALAYAVLIHYGVGPSNKGIAWHWYTPRTFLLDVELLYPVFETTGRALLGTALPALALVALAFATCRSAVGRALALASLVAVLLYTYYGVQAPRIWEFFHWRASAVLALTALVVGLLAGGPLARGELAASALGAASADLPADRLRSVRARAQCHRHRREPDLRDLAVAGGARLRHRGSGALHRGLARRDRGRPARDREIAPGRGAAGAGSACDAAAAGDRPACPAALDRLAARALSVPRRCRRRSSARAS